MTDLLVHYLSTARQQYEIIWSKSHPVWNNSRIY